MSMNSMEGILGLLKVRVIRGIDLAVQDVRSSDPYVKVEMDDQVGRLCLPSPALAASSARCCCRASSWKKKMGAPTAESSPEFLPLPSVVSASATELSSAVA